MKELEDYTWFPQFLRNYQTDYIGFVVSKFNIYKVFIDYLKSHKLKSSLMYDLCSGSGEPAISIYSEVQNFKSLFLSDKYPRLNFIENSIIYIDESVDVNDMQFISGNTYTMFNAFHHFTDEEKQNIVSKCNEAKANLFVVEILEPSILFVLKVLVLTTFGVLLFNPFIKPFSWKRLIFTYILPLNILTISIDGIISVMKSRSLNAYQNLFASNNKVKVFKLKRGISSLVVIELTHI